MFRNVFRHPDSCFCAGTLCEILVHSFAWTLGFAKYPSSRSKSIVTLQPMVLIDANREHDSPIEQGTQWLSGLLYQAESDFYCCCARKSLSIFMEALTLVT
eukprot:267348-Pelagomonas_calceolata.AAC.3